MEGAASLPMIAVAWLVMRRVDYLERVNDPVHVCGPFSFVSSADDVKDFIAAVEAVQVALGG
jgi:hypothetical protein